MQPPHLGIGKLQFNTFLFLCFILLCFRINFLVYESLLQAHRDLCTGYEPYIWPCPQFNDRFWGRGSYLCWARCTYFSPPYVGEYDMVAINGNSLYICAVFMLHTIHAPCSFCITGKKSFKINGMAIFVMSIDYTPKTCHNCEVEKIATCVGDV